jgi:hypothetical protein
MAEIQSRWQFPKARGSSLSRFGATLNPFSHLWFDGGLHKSVIFCSAAQTEDLLQKI